MGIRDVAWNTVKWQFMKKRLGYTDEEMKKFRENPRNEDVLSKVPEFLNKTIIDEVVDSHGFNSRIYPHQEFCQNPAVRRNTSCQFQAPRPISRKPSLRFH